MHSVRILHFYSMLEQGEHVTVNFLQSSERFFVLNVWHFVESELKCVIKLESVG
jgi:hypothetical protein